MKSFTKQRIREHLRNDWYYYLIIIAASFILTSFIGNFIKVETPADKKVDIMMVTATCADYALPYQSNLMLKDSSFKDLKEINFYYRDKFSSNVGYLIASWMYSSEGDVFILDKTYFESASRLGGLKSLNEYIDNGTLNVPDDIKEKCYTVDGKIYGLPLSYLKGFENLKMSTENTYIGLTNYSKNPEDALKAVKWLWENMQTKIDQDTFDNNVTQYLGGVYK